MIFIDQIMAQSHKNPAVKKKLVLWVNLCCRQWCEDIRSKAVWKGEEACWWLGWAPYTAAQPKPCLFFTRSLWLLRLHGAYIWAGSTPWAPQEPHSTIPHSPTCHMARVPHTVRGRVGFLNQPAPGVFKSAPASQRSQTPHLQTPT